jgi:molecular chaperone Hsp33
MTEEELKRKYKGRDRFISVLSKNGSFRTVLVKNTMTVRTAQNNHNLDNIGSYYLAKTLTASTMISAFLKGEERIIIEINANGLLSKVYAETLHIGECRGFIKYANNTNQNLITLSDIFGENATMKISRILYNQTEPIVGIIPMQSGDISSDLSFYFSQSEQINSAVIIDVNFDDNNIVSSSGGILIQAMPGALQEEIDEIVQAITNINSISSELEENLSLEDILHEHLPFDFDVLKTKPIDFFCRCNIKAYKSQLFLLGIKEIEEMQKAGQNELVCQYCNKHYYLSDEDFNEIICQLKAMEN